MLQGKIFFVLLHVKNQSSGIMSKKQPIMQAVIIDDNPIDIEQLQTALKDYPQLNIIGTYRTGNAGMAALEKLKPDVAFLDIELPDMLGLELIEGLSQEVMMNCRFVVYSAFPGHMLESFRKHAFDFLLKPIVPSDLEGIVHRLIDAYAVKKSEEFGPGEKKQNQEESLLMFINSTDFRIMRLCDIGLFQYNANSRLWEAIVANTPKPVRLKRSVSNKMLLGLGPQMIQVHQRYIVNINSLSQVIDNKCYFYPPFENIDYVKIGITYRRQLLEKFCCL